MNLKIEWLKYFVTFCEFNSFTESAEKLGITVSSFSQNMNALEKCLGTQLIIRKPKHNEITPEGYIFLEKARETMMKFEGLEAVFKDFSQKNKKDILKISWSNIWGSNILPELIEVLLSLQSNIYPQIYAFTIEESIKFIELNEIDFAIITLKNGDDSFFKNKEQISYLSGRKIFFVEINADNPDIKKIYLNGSFNKNNDYCIKTASINSLLYLCDKGFSTSLPEILINKDKFKSIKVIENKFIQPALIWNKNIPENKLRKNVIEIFTEINKL